MLVYLSIRDFAIIDELKVEFDRGFCVLTGETGAGKSILIQALHLLLGGRASNDLIRTDADAAEVEGVFNLQPGSRAILALDRKGLLEGEEVTIRRIVSRTGRSRVFINDHPAGVGTLGELTAGLVDISGQHEHVELTDEETHREILDDFGKLAELRGEVKLAVSKLRALAKEQRELQEKDRECAEREEYLTFVLKRISEIDPRPGEDQELYKERLRLRNAEKLSGGLRVSVGLVYQREGSAVELLGQAATQLSGLLKFDSDLSALRDRLEEASRLIEDLSRDLETSLEGLDSDPARLEEVEDRLSALKGLMRSHGPDLPAVLEKRSRMQAELAALGDLSSRLDELEQRRRQALDYAMKLARRLSVKRKQAAKTLQQKLEGELGSLAMEAARVEVQVVAGEAQDLEEWGLDRVRLLLSANPGEEVKPLARVASGGELSRVLLALKAVLSGVDRVPTYVFDEVDSGVGGAVAEVIGSKLSAVSSDHQVVCITHLPQIAAWANSHYLVQKHVSGGRTVCEISRLDENERIEELARMAGSARVTEKARGHARGHARALLNAVRSSKTRF
jgi:DNA repair protein RecN (Recombination protein N)